MLSHWVFSGVRTGGGRSDRLSLNEEIYACVPFFCVVRFHCVPLKLKMCVKEH